MYQYKAVVYEVVDGDTFKANVDLGFRVSINEKFRMIGINAPEMNTDAGKQAKDFLAQQIAGAEIEMIVHGQDKYGRWLATVYKGPQNINQLMIDSGHAVEYKAG